MAPQRAQFWKLMEDSYSVKMFTRKNGDMILRVKRGRKVLAVGEYVGIEMRWIPTKETVEITSDLRTFVNVTANARCMIREYQFRLGYAYLALRDAFGVMVAERCAGQVMGWIYGRGIDVPISKIDLFTEMMEANATRAP